MSYLLIYINKWLLLLVEAVSESGEEHFTLTLRQQYQALSGNIVCQRNFCYTCRLLRKPFFYFFDIHMPCTECSVLLTCATVFNIPTSLYSAVAQ